MNISKQKDFIIRLLITHPELRDNDYQLIATIWEYESDNPTTITAAQFLMDFGNGKYTNPESIRRCRAKLQEEMPELRGEKYIERHRHQIDVIDQLKELSKYL